MSIVQTTLAVKSSLYSVSLQLSLVLSARDNLEAFFSYVEDVREIVAEDCKSVSSSFTPPFPSFPPSVSFSPSGSIPLQQRGQEGGSF